MARLRGRAPRGERCRAGVPHGHWKTTTFTGALRLTGMTAPFVYDGAMNGAVFLAYVEQVLVPTLKPGDIVIMDNLPAHKAAGVRQAIERLARHSACCRHTAPTSIQSRMPSQSSRRFCVPKQSEQSRPCGMPSARSSNYSPRLSAKTTSRQQAMIPIKPDVL